MITNNTNNSNVEIDLQTARWKYSITTGLVYTPKGEVLTRGYAGRDVYDNDILIFAGKNNPDFQHLKDIGPLPCGIYYIMAPRDDAKVGKYALPLIPFPSNNMYGRADFYLHGENKKHPGDSSEGCPVLGLVYRQKIWTMLPNSHLLEVVL